MVLEEIKQGQDDPDRMAAQGLFQIAFDQHPYGRPIIGSPESVRALTRDRLFGFFKQRYVASNVTLVVVGDVDAGRARTAIEQAFGDMPDGPQPGPRPQQPQQGAPRVRAIARDVKECQLLARLPRPGGGPRGHSRAGSAGGRAGPGRKLAPEPATGAQPPAGHQRVRLHLRRPQPRPVRRRRLAAPGPPGSRRPRAAGRDLAARPPGGERRGDRQEQEPAGERAGVRQGDRAGLRPQARFLHCHRWRLEVRGPLLPAAERGRSGTAAPGGRALPARRRAEPVRPGARARPRPP